MTIDRLRKAAAQIASSARGAARSGNVSGAPAPVRATRAATSAAPLALDAGAVGPSRRARGRANAAQPKPLPSLRPSPADAGEGEGPRPRARESVRAKHTGEGARRAAFHSGSDPDNAGKGPSIYVPEDFDPDFVRAPSLLLMALEWRASFEFGATLASLPWLARAAPGDGHPVLVFPGLIAGDITTAALRAYLKSRGYDVHGWQQGVNLGPRPGVIEACVRRVRQLADRAGRRASLVGWSLGGVYAREIAKEIPQDVRCVITLGSPFTGHPRATNAWRVYAVAAGHHAHHHPRRTSLGTPPPRPTTSIYSRTDGVVAWQCSLNPKTAHTENIEVVASHLGIGMNPAAMYAIADRLAQPEGAWQPFHREGWRSLVYPAPQWP